MATIKRVGITPRLPVRPFPLKGESLRGYLLRVGERNGYGKGMNLYRRLTGNRNSRFLISEQAIDRAAESLQLSRDAIAFISYRRIPGEFERRILFFGHQVFQGQLRNKQPAICPECLREQQAISGLWDLNAVCTCPQHGTWLVDLCPACGEALTWCRPLITMCLCGFDLQQIEAKPAPSDVLALTALIHQRALNGLPGCDEQTSIYPATVSKIPLGYLLRIFDLVPSTAMRNSIDKQAQVYVTKWLAYNGQAALMLSQLLKSRPSELLRLLAGYATSMDEASLALASLTRSRFNERYWQLNSLVQLAPELFQQVVYQFVDEHRICDKGQGRYLDPFAVWCMPNGERVLKLKTCLVAIGLPSNGVHEDETISFSSYLQMKAGSFAVSDPTRCSTLSSVALAKTLPCPEPR